jgi:DNA-binding Xre family transcriptional regulator
MNIRDNIRAQINAMIDDLVDTPEDAAAVKTELDRIESERQVVDYLLDSRLAAGITQRALAAASGLSPSKICRMESGNDSTLRLGDVKAYCSGLGIPLPFTISRPLSLPRPSRPRARRPRPVPVLA